MRAGRDSECEVLSAYRLAPYTSGSADRGESEISVLFRGKQNVDPPVTAVSSPQGFEAAAGGINSTRAVPGGGTWQEMRLNTSNRDARRRAAVMEAIIPRPSADIAPMRGAFSRMVSRQWQSYVPTVLAHCRQGLSDAKFAKGRFIAEMYARACYSMLIVSASGPSSLRVPVRATALLPRSRGLTIRLGSALLAGM